MKNARAALWMTLAVLLTLLCFGALADTVKYSENYNYYVWEYSLFTADDGVEVYGLPNRRVDISLDAKDGLSAHSEPYFTGPVVYFPSRVSSRSGDTEYTVTSLGYLAASKAPFSSYTAMTAAVIPSSVRVLGPLAFSNCANLRELNLPTSVVSIGKDCFKGCSGITVYYDGTPSQWSQVTLHEGNEALANVICRAQDAPAADDPCKEEYAGWYVVSTGGANLAINSGHGTASQGYTQLGSIPNGAEIYISKATGYWGKGSSGGQWGHVTYNGVTGLCAMNLLIKSDGAEDTCSEQYAGWYTVSTGGANLAINSGHGTASQGYAQLGVIPDGASVYISKATGYWGKGSSGGQWGHVTYNGVTGLCAMNLLVRDAEPPQILGAWYSHVSPAGFTVGCQAQDAGSGIAECRVRVWSDAMGEDNAYWHTSYIDNMRSCFLDRRIDLSAFGGAVNTAYHVQLYLYDGNGSCDARALEDVYLEDVPPTVSEPTLETMDDTGFTLCCRAEDASAMDYVSFHVWTKAEGEENAVWHNARRDETDPSLWRARVELSRHGAAYPAEFCALSRAKDSQGNAGESAVISLRLPPEQPLPGDVTGDGEVNIMDVIRLLKAVSGWAVEINKDAADVTGDGETTIMDVIRLLKYVSGWEVRLG